MKSTNPVGYYDPVLAVRGEKFMEQACRELDRMGSTKIRPRYLVVRPAVWDCLVAKLIQSSNAFDEAVRAAPPNQYPFFGLLIMGIPVVCTHRPGASDWAFTHTLNR